MGCAADTHVCSLATLCVLSGAALDAGGAGQARVVQRFVWNFRVSGCALGLLFDSLVAHAASPASDSGRPGVRTRTADARRLPAGLGSFHGIARLACKRALQTGSDESRLRGT